MESTPINWYAGNGELQSAILPRNLPAREIEKMQEYFQNTAQGPQNILRSMQQHNAPRFQDEPARKIADGVYEGLTQDEVNFLKEQGLAFEELTQEEEKYLRTRVDAEEQHAQIGFQEHSEAAAQAAPPTTTTCTKRAHPAPEWIVAAKRRRLLDTPEIVTTVVLLTPSPTTPSSQQTGTWREIDRSSPDFRWIFVDGWKELERWKRKDELELEDCPSWLQALVIESVDD